MANTLDLINASAGTGEAVRPNITIARSAGATIITVDSVANWPAKFVATAGKIVGTALTTPLVFAGHISGTTIIIDTIAPGYADTLGNAVGDVLVLKPSTLWADNIAGVLAVAHNNDGTIINQTITAVKIAANTITAAQITNNTITGTQMNLAHAVDGNGWRVHDYGTFKEYLYSPASFSPLVVYGAWGASNCSQTVANNIPLPVGVTAATNLSFQVYGAGTTSGSASNPITYLLQINGSNFDSGTGGSLTIIANNPTNQTVNGFYTTVWIRATDRT